MSQKPLVPPRFAIAAAPFLYDPDLPHYLYRTYARITGLAWQRESESRPSYERTPPLTIYELAVICHLSVRNMWRQIKELNERGLLNWETRRGVQSRLVFYPTWPGSTTEMAIELFADPGVVESILGLDSESPGYENLAALAEFGVNVLESFARQVAALPHVTPGLIHAWGQDLLHRRGIRNLPGLLLYILQTTSTPPGDQGDGQLPSDSSPVQASLLEPSSAPAEGLLDDLGQALRGLGWEGDLGEVAEIVARDGDGGQRVQAWVAHVEERRGRYTNPAGFLRTALRGEEWPEEERGHDPERGQPSWSENIGDRLDVV